MPNANAPSQSRFYDIVHFARDLVALGIPGFVFMALVVTVLVPKDMVDSVGAEIRAADNWATEVFLLAAAVVCCYLTGLIVDALTYRLTDWAAAFWFRDETPRQPWYRRDLWPWAWSHEPVKAWNGARRRYSRRFGASPDAGMTEKAHFESRALANLAVLLVAFVVVAVVWRHLCGPYESLLHEVRVKSPVRCCLRLGLCVLGYMCFLASSFRQRRRVVGVRDALEEQQCGC